MPVPEVERVVFKRNPIRQVICQLRFPPILMIDTDLEAKAKFQERIRHQYPFLENRVEGQNLLPQEVQQLFPSGIVESMFNSNRFYDFRSEDRQWAVTLSKDFLSLSCGNYERWENFHSHLQKPLEALIEIYRPALFSRVGLRYQNIIRRSELGLSKDENWSELLQPYIAAEFSSNLAPDEILDVKHVIVVNLNGGEKRVRMQHGLIQDDSGEICYLIDNDFFTEERTDTSNAITVLNYLNQQSKRYFHWCIKPRLRDAMEPEHV